MEKRYQTGRRRPPPIKMAPQKRPNFPETPPKRNLEPYKKNIKLDKDKIPPRRYPIKRGEEISPRKPLFTLNKSPLLRNPPKRQFRPKKDPSTRPNLRPRRPPQDLKNFQKDPKNFKRPSQDPKVPKKFQNDPTKEPQRPKNEQDPRIPENEPTLRKFKRPQRPKIDQKPRNEPTKIERKPSQEAERPTTETPQKSVNFEATPKAKFRPQTTKKKPFLLIKDQRRRLVSTRNRVKDESESDLQQLRHSQREPTTFSPATTPQTKIINNTNGKNT